MNRNVIAQTGVADLKFELVQIAENLALHLNASLSKAHGINVIAGFTDEFGNDRTTYQDSNGDVLGNFFVRFTVATVVFYAPAVVTGLTGWPATTGEIDTAGDDQTDASVATTAWVTDYTSEQVEQAEAINDAVLIPHTRVAHGEAHGALSVIVRDSFDSAGHLYATHIIGMRIGGLVYNIPVTTRLGGPGQAPRFNPIPEVTFQGPVHGQFGQNGIEISEVVEGGEEWPTSATWRTYLYGGTFPMSYQWEFSPDNTNWQTLDISASVNGCGYNGTPAAVSTIETSVPYFDVPFQLQTPGGNNSATFFMRLRISNSAGTFYNTTCRVYQKDATSKFLCGMAHALGYIPRRVYFGDLAWANKNVSPVILYGYSLWGRPLARWFLKHPQYAPLSLFVVRNWAEWAAWKNGTLQKPNWKGRIVWGVLGPICWLLGQVHGSLAAFGLCQRPK